MTAKRRSGDLFSTRWVHVFEEDTPEGAVYRPDDEHVPLSRKPRGWLEFHEDGSATIFAPGPASPAELEIVDRSPSRVVVRGQP